MKFSTTDGQVYDVANMCAFCNMDTGGNHQPFCPCYQPLQTYVPQVKTNILFELTEQGLADIKAWKFKRLNEIRKSSHERLGQAWKELAK